MSGPRSAAATTAAVAVASWLLAGCPGEELTCVEVDLACAPLYEPTFANIFTLTLEPKCAVSNACHAGARPRGGLDLSEEQRAFDGLLEVAQGRVVPGDASCSELIERVTNTGGFQMPPGDDAHLSAAEVCALTQWVAAGAPRDGVGGGVDAGVDAP